MKPQNVKKQVTKLELEIMELESKLAPATDSYVKGECHAPGAEDPLKEGAYSGVVGAEC